MSACQQLRYRCSAWPNISTDGNPAWWCSKKVQQKQHLENESRVLEIVSVLWTTSVNYFHTNNLWQPRTLCPSPSIITNWFVHPDGRQLNLCPPPLYHVCPKTSKQAIADILINSWTFRGNSLINFLLMDEKIVSWWSLFIILLS